MTKHHPAVTTIVARVAALYGVDVEAIFSRARTKTVAEARLVAMWAARLRLGWSFPELGLAFERDHTTVLANCHEVDVRRAIGTASKLMLTALELFSADQLASTELDLNHPRGEGSEVTHADGRERIARAG